MMSKDDELAVLREAIARLGRNSYCGPWLEEQLPFVEADMRSDFPVSVTLRGTQSECERLLSVARTEAAELLRRAQGEAEKIREQARTEACWTRNRLLRELDQCRNTLGVAA